MPKRTYALAEGGPKRLELVWKFNWNNLVVKLDGQQIGGPFSKADLERQVLVTLPDKSMLGVMLERSLHQVDLHVNLDGKPLPGSASHPQTQLKGAYAAIFFVAGVNIILGIGALAFGWQVLTDIGGGVGSLIYGGVFLALGMFVMMQRSRVALGIALALFVVDSALIMFNAFTGPGEPGFHGVIMRVLVIVFMFRGFAAIGELEQADVQARGV
jgi:hypothetical protein